jgi:hypothetical protein
MKCHICLSDKLCSGCIDKWTLIKQSVYEGYRGNSGRKNIDQIHFLESEIDRLENLWKKNKNSFIRDLNKLKI